MPRGRGNSIRRSRVPAVAEACRSRFYPMTSRRAGWRKAWDLSSPVRWASC